MARVRKANGFSLIEVMVALAVFAVAALALLRLEAASLAGSATLDRRLLREIVLGNCVMAWRSDPGAAPSAAGGVAGGVVINAGRRFGWEQRLSREGGLVVARFTVRALDAPQEASVARVVQVAP